MSEKEENGQEEDAHLGLGAFQRFDNGNFKQQLGIFIWSKGNSDIKGRAKQLIIDIRKFTVALKSNKQFLKTIY